MSNIPSVPSIPTEPMAANDFIHRGWSNYIQGNFTDAEADFRQALTMNAQAADAEYGLGLSLKSQQRASDALLSFEHVIELVNSGAYKDDLARGTMIRHLTTWQISTLRGKNDKSS